MPRRKQSSESLIEVYRSAAFERGRRDAQRRLPPQEALLAYLEGYASQENFLLRKPREGAGKELAYAR